MKLKIVAVCASLVLAATAAHAEDQLVKEAGGWEIYRAPDMGNGCYMSSVYEDGTIIQVGFDLQEDAGFMSVIHADWADIEDAKIYPVSITMDAEEYTADGQGMNLGDAGGIFVLVETEDFLVDLGTRKTLSLANEGGEVALVDLSGTRDAILAISDCLEGA